MKLRLWIRRIVALVSVVASVMVVVTAVVNVVVDRAAEGKIYADAASAPRNRVGLLLGTSPMTRSGSPNSYFTSRIQTAAELFRLGKIDFIIASGDNRTRYYNEPFAMRDALVAAGVPQERIVLDYAGFRTLDSVVRAKKVFGCEEITIVSQADHCARALFLAEANGISAVAVAAPLVALRRVRVRMAVREWLARDKMMLDIVTGKAPHFLGEQIEVK
ncbi:MAG: YdcF family protein [Muribaculaceae bacterium]|nr:YdcF family protein [Muribaculaceae bacterium]MDE6315566.1 YdcF family protein [Muribaculaceae bacterium]MDE6461698.1 YdcF family protein [Muribaculaceae bacterium]MDE6510279.1 YdcF family protein [Muribaculaceae bacterium]